MDPRTIIQRAFSFFRSTSSFWIGCFCILVLGGIGFALRARYDQVVTHVSLQTPLGLGQVQAQEDELLVQVHTKTSQLNADNRMYFPRNTTPVFSDPIAIPVSAYGVMDRDTKELLYGRDIFGEHTIASVTKIMTTILALEEAPLNLSITISSSAAVIGEATMGLDSGEQLSLEHLLYGAMLPSGNDAAEAIAEGVGKYKRGLLQHDVDGGGARRWFLSQMNQKAQSLGMYDTYFFNPTGLDEETAEQTSFSTVYDLLALTAYALENQTFADIAKTRFLQIPFQSGLHKAFYLENILKFDASYPGIAGVKPGNSIFARETLVSYVERNGRRIIVVILGSDHTKDDVIQVYKTVFGP